MRSELVMKSLQPIMFIQRQNNSSTICLLRQNRHYFTLSRTFKQHAYTLLKNLQFCGIKAESELNISMICGGGADVEQTSSELERTWSQKIETPSISDMQAIAGAQSAVDATLFPTHSSHLCCHERAG